MGEVFKTKEEYCGFLNYLMKKRDPVIDHIKRFGGLSLGMVDQGEYAETIQNRIRNYEDVDTAYVKIAMERYLFRGKREQRKEFKDISYSEDLEEYLLSLGIEGDRAKKLTKHISLGQYSEYCKHHIKSETLQSCGNIHEFACAIGSLGSWDYIASYFPTEVQNFKNLRKQYFFQHVINGIFHAKYFRVRPDEEKGIRCLAEKISILLNRLFSSFGIKRFKCPVCGKRSYTARGAFEICSECGWEDEGIDDDDEEPVFGPNGDYTIREYREEYRKKKEEDPSYNWWKSVQDDD